MVKQVNLAETAKERDEQELQELMEQTRTCLTITFNNVEYILGNAEFDSDDLSYQKLELMYQHLSKISQNLDNEQYDEMTRK